MNKPDFLTSMFKWMSDNQIAELNVLQETLDKVENRTGIDVRNYLDFGTADKPLHQIKYEKG